MRMDEIGVFVRVLEAGSFAAAARTLGMPKATVSAKVAALERRLKVTLIQRTTRRLRATDAGQVFFEACRESIASIAAAEAALAAQREEPTGILRITAPAVSGRSMLPQLIKSYRALYPAVRVDAILVDREIDLVAEGIDLALRVGPLKDSSLVARLFVEGTGGLFASARYLERRGVPRLLEDLLQHDMIGLGRPSAGRPMFRSMAIDIVLDPVITCDDFYMVRALLMADMGIGYLPYLMARPDADESMLVRVLEAHAPAPRGLYFVYPQQPFVPAKVRSFIAHALEHAEEWR